MVHAYERLIALYPADYKTLFAAEMVNAFADAAVDRRALGRVVFVRFALVETIGVLGGIAGEWLAKWTSDRSVRGRCLPDLRTMRPPGVSKQEHYG